MQRNLLARIVVATLVAAPQCAFASLDGATSGLVGGAAAGAIVDGPIGAVVGGAITGPGRDTVVAQPGSPCNSSLTRTPDDSGAGGTTQTTTRPN